MRSDRTPRRAVQLVGKTDGVARGLTVLGARPVDAIRGHADVRDYGDVALPSASSKRRRNPHHRSAGLGEMAARVRDTVARSRRRELPLVIGGIVPSCWVPAAADEAIGSVSCSSTATRTPIFRSSRPPARPRTWSSPSRSASPTRRGPPSQPASLVEPADVRILGARDASILRAEGVPSLGDSIELADGIRPPPIPRTS
jgi:hypothetical protein